MARMDLLEDVLLAVEEEDWLEQLEKHVEQDEQLKTVKHFRCCLRVPGEGELQCQPFRRRSTLFGKLRDNIQLNCESDLLYDITLNKVLGARAQRVI